MTSQELRDISFNIAALVGRQSDWLTPHMNTDERMKTRAAYDMLCESLLNMVEAQPAQAAALSCFVDKFCVTGTTATYKKFAYYKSAGILYINGEMVLTSAPVAQVWEYLITH